MTLQDILKLEQTQSESQIQHTCVAWFRYTFPNHALQLWGIPNGGMRTGASGAMRKYEGAIAGASDIVFFHKKGGYGALHIEMKVPKVRGKQSAGNQSEAQKKMQAAMERAGYKYVICHGLQEFIEELCLYAQIDYAPYLDDVCENYETYRKAKL